MKNVLKLCFICIIFFACNADTKEAATEPAAEPAAAEAEKKPAYSELLDMSVAEPAKKGLQAFAAGDIDGMTAEYADNIRYTWSSGDSLIGKQAVKDYYTKRRALIDSITYSDYVFLPVQVNEVQTPYAPAGKWVLYWAFAHVKYKNGKKLNFWLHQVNHYNDAGKIDLASQYIDRAPIMAASK
jgi:ketosteroid isomerase-like protein